MRLYTENTEQYIQLLANSITKDHASLDAWRCLHIHPKDPSMLDIRTIQAVRLMYAEMDCDIIVCPDNDVLLISRDMDIAAMQSLAVAISLNMITDEPEVQCYEIITHWRSIRQLLLSKVPHAIPTQTPEIEDANFGEITALGEVFATAKQLRKSRHPQYVLLVEDDSLTRHLVANALKNDYAMVTATNAKEAVSHYLLHAPDVVFLDIGLPDASGFSVLKEIMNVDKDAYVVMFSSNHFLDNVTKAFAAGASGFIAKPFKKEKLRHYIESSSAHYHKSA